MISLTDNIPAAELPRAEWIRLSVIYECYRDYALFWEQNNGRAFLCLLDGDMTVYNVNADTEELSRFIEVISPSSIFTDAKTLRQLGRIPSEKAHVMCRKAAETEAEASDEVNSRKVFEIFSKAGLECGNYGYFAVDFCRKINHGFADCFLKDGKCAAYSVHSGDFALLQGIASFEKGMGTAALKAMLDINRGRQLLACCRDKVCGFYEKNGFRELYQTAIWVK